MKLKDIINFVRNLQIVEQIALEKPMEVKPLKNKRKK